MESKSFLIAHAFTSKWEGGISDHPNDRGGITAYGASIEFVRDIASTSSGRNFLYAIGVPIPVNRDVIRNLNHGQVRAMFKRQFWDSRYRRIGEGSGGCFHIRGTIAGQSCQACVSGRHCGRNGAMR